MTRLPQSSTEDAGNDTWPVIVVGAGPAGAICALTLARAGHKVLLLDKAAFPRDKVCGDLLIPDAVDLLQSIDLLENVKERAVAHRAVRIFSPGRTDFVVPGRFYGLRRLEFDHILAQAAVSAGAVLVQGKVVHIRNGELTCDVNVDGSDHSLHAEVVVLATGASVNLADKLGLIERRSPSAVAIRAYFESDCPLDEIILAYERSLLPGYAWVYRVGEQRYNIGCGIITRDGALRTDNLQTCADLFIKEFPIAREVVARGTQVSQFRGAPLRCGLTGYHSLVHKNVLCIGEVIGTTFPFTGEGIGKAMHSGRIAGEVIDHALREHKISVLQEYASRIDREQRPLYYGYAIAEKWLAHPWLSDLLAGRVRRSRYLQQQVTSFVDETGDPRRLFSLASLIKSLWK
ncbi:MAG: geranylgeranyl reductase family protein [Candidatus Zixiibacteriota bacterium]